MSRNVILVFLLIFSTVVLGAYPDLSVPINANMSRAEVEEILGKPGFLIYSYVRIFGIPEPIEVSMSGYRVPEKEGPGRLINMVFFQDNVQLALTVFYEKKEQQKLLSKILKQKRLEKIEIRGVQGYLNGKTLDFYLSDEAEVGLEFPPPDLKKYLDTEDFMNHAVVERLVDMMAQQVRPTVNPALYGLTYMNLRLVASVATQGMLTPRWRK